MNTNKITNLPLPTTNGDAVNKKYVDDSSKSLNIDQFLKKRKRFT